MKPDFFRSQRSQGLTEFAIIAPIIQQAVGNQIIITAYAVYRAEYSN